MKSNMLLCKNVPTLIVDHCCSYSISRVLIVFILFYRVINGYHLAVEGHDVAKRIDSDSCLGRFDVQRDMIIRTEESRSMGAKFIDHADLSGRDECLRLCCETDECDVFVFEEKLQGTCFLFHCGPAQNFRCKFTHHENYTSAVLTPAKKVEPPPPPMATFPIQPPIQLGPSQHEIELSNLKDTPTRGMGNSNNNGLEMSTTLLPPLGIRIADITTTLKPPAASIINSAICSRFQFQCHSGECIAVYNACDGIPQCVDGSDEGPECPANAVVTSKPLGMSDNNNRYMSQVNDMAQSSSQRTMAVVPLQKVISVQPNGQRPYQIVAHNREDPMTAPQWPPRSPSGNSGQPYGDTDSRIFNHKGGLQLPNNNNIAAQYSSNNGYIIPPAQREPYMQPMQESYRIPQWVTDQRLPPPQWSQQQSAMMMSNDGQISILQPPKSIDIPSDASQQIREQQQQPTWPIQPLMPVIPANDHHSVNDQQKQNKHDGAVTTKKEKPIETISNNNNDDQQAPDIDDSSDYEEEDKPTDPPVPPPPAIKKKQRKHKNKENKDKKEKSKKQHEHDAGEHEHERPVHEQLKIIKSDLDMEFMDHDGAAKRPGGAVLSLTLGIIVTAALAVLVGCRATVVRRRARRGGKSTYAHDADFLVNGMYL